MQKPILNHIIVVEGKTDTSRLKSLFDVQTIETNGSDLKKSTLNLIKEISKTKKIVLFLDPDYAGEKIRKQITKELNIDFYQCFISKKDIKTNSKKIGIAEATDESIIKALDNMISFSKDTNSISLEEFNDLRIDSKDKRLIICNSLKISYCNGKQLFKRLNMMNITKEELINILKKQ